MLVVDASAALEVLLRTPAAPTIEAQLFAGRESLHAPDPLDLEVLRILRRVELEGAIDAARAAEARAALADMRIVRHPSRPLLDRAWTLRHDITIADGLYVALAQGLGADLLTTDLRFARAAATHAGVATRPL